MRLYSEYFPLKICLSMQSINSALLLSTKLLSCNSSQLYVANPFVQSIFSKFLLCTNMSKTVKFTTHSSQSQGFIGSSISISFLSYPSTSYNAHLYALYLDLAINAEGSTQTIIKSGCSLRLILVNASNVPLCL